MDEQVSTSLFTVLCTALFQEDINAKNPWSTMASGTNHYGSRYHPVFRRLTNSRHSRTPTSPQPVTGLTGSDYYTCGSPDLLRKQTSSTFRTGSQQPPALWSFRSRTTFRHCNWFYLNTMPLILSTATSHELFTSSGVKFVDFLETAFPSTEK